MRLHLGKNERTANLSYMQKVKRLLGEKVTLINKFYIDTEKLNLKLKEINKRKNWTAPGIDGVQNVWWKKLVVA